MLPCVNEKPVVTVIDIGSHARYAKTGTVGTVTRFEEQLGQTFAELDSTGLLYRLDQLTTVSAEEKAASHHTVDEDLKRLKIERESVGSTAYSEAVFQQDGACHGGG